MVIEAIATAIEHLSRRSHFRDGRRVTSFLTLHPELVTTLHQALDRLPSSFGAGVPLILEVVPDYEDEVGVESLFAYVRTPLDPEHAMPLLQRLTDDWWREASRRVTDRFAFSLEYV